MIEHLLGNASDLYCHGIARIEQMGPNRQLA
jgi:hypothetical protein